MGLGARPGTAAPAEDEQHRPARSVEIALRGQRQHRWAPHPVEQGEQSRLGALPTMLPRLAALHEDERRIALDVEPLAQACLDGAVHLANLDIRGLVGHLVEDRGEPFAVAAPRRVKLDEPERVRLGGNRGLPVGRVEHLHPGSRGRRQRGYRQHQAAHLS